MEKNVAGLVPGRSEASDVTVSQIDALEAEGNSWGLPYGPDWAVLHFEYMSEGKMRMFTIFIRLFVAIVLAVYIGLIAGGQPVLWSHFGRQSVFTANVPLGCLALLLLMSLLILTCYRLWLVRLHQQRWEPRRWKQIPFSLLKGVVTSCMIICFIAGNSYIIDRPCVVFVHSLAWIIFARLSAVNMLAFVYVVEMHSLVILRGKDGQPDRYVGSRNLVMAHWPEALVWGLLQGGCVMSLAWQLTQDEQELMMDAQGDCVFRDDICDIQSTLRSSERSIQTLLCIYGFLMILYCIMALRRLRARPYQDHKLANIKLRLLARSHLVALLLYNLAFLLSANLGPNECERRSLILYSFPPSTVLVTAVAMLDLVLYLPKRPEFEPHSTIADRQLVAWTKEEEPQLRRHLKEHAEGEGMPLFCMETALKLFRWSVLVYDYTETVPSDALTPDLKFMKDVAEPMSWHGLRRLKLLWNAEREVKALLSWSEDTILVAFRGSAATANFVADATVVQTNYPPDSARRWWQESPMVHLGFLQTWQALSSPTRAAARSRSAPPPSAAPPRRGQAARAESRFAELVEGLPPLPRRLWAWFWGKCFGWRSAVAGSPSATTASSNQLVREVFTLLEAAPGGPASVKLLFTGHSLGGALATLAAFDVQRACQLQPSQIQVYTFGCPRQGNHVFAKLYAAAVPHTWHVVNDRDMVCRSMKLMGAYKRAGERTIINPSGHLIVRPCYIELFLLKAQFAGRVSHHLLSSYRRSLAAVLRAALAHGVSESRKARLHRLLAMMLPPEQQQEQEGGCGKDMEEGGCREDASAEGGVGAQPEDAAGQRGWAGGADSSSSGGVGSGGLEPAVAEQGDAGELLVADREGESGASGNAVQPAL